MCGIFFDCTEQKMGPCGDADHEYLKRRGPDSLKTVYRQVSRKPASPTAGEDPSSSFLTFVATVLSLRGDSIVEQPLEDIESGSILCWNGEAWKINGKPVVGNDTVAVLDLLLKAVRPHSANNLNKNFSSEETSQAVVDVLSMVSGPSAFVFYDAQWNRIFYGRDALGRRSLLHKVGQDGNLSLSSICCSSMNKDWTEVEAGCIYRFEFFNKADEPQKSINCHDENMANINAVKHTHRSDGNDDRLNKIGILKNSFPKLNKDTTRTSLSPLCSNSITVDILAQNLHASLLLRLQNVPSPPTTITGPSRIAVLFSGGLDCTLLARLMHDILPLECDVDLLNVAFENPRVVRAARSLSSQSSSPLKSAYSLCPDRSTGLSSHSELVQVCPGRTWRFVSIDISYSETIAHRSRIAALMHPHNTEMDLSIACALYFAARGSGTVRDPVGNSIDPYITPARVLVSGLGADELFAGYTRHATAFHRMGYEGLVNELELDFNRLGKRNLGRDDRVISNWGREARYPYLDEDLVRWVLQLPVWEKCGFGQILPVEAEFIDRECLDLEHGKKLLRLLAWKLDMKVVARERKRAIQFGARTAKMEAGRTKGTQELS